MKDRILMWVVAGGLVLAGSSMTAIGEAEETIDTAQAAVEAADEAVESAEAALQAVEEVGEELDAAGVVVEEIAEIESVEEVVEAEAVEDAVAAVEDEAVAAVEDEAVAENPEYVMPEATEAMEAWMLSASPSEHHAKLDAFVGTWDVTTSMWFAPGMPPQVNQGTSEIKWILDGRYIQENFQGQMQMPGAEPQAFQGLGITGYDNVKGQYIGTWADTMSTAAISSVGQFDETTQTLTLNSEFDCPMDGPCSMRMVIGAVNTDEVLMQAYKTVQGQEEAKCMEIVYTRRP